MKKWLISVSLMLLLVLCAGCSKNTSLKANGSQESNNETENQSDEEKVTMTEQQEEVFRSYGLSDERIEKMKQEGLTYKEQSFVDKAIVMLNYLEEKYGEKFRVVGGDIPGILSDEYWITAEACEGKYAGKKFNVNYLSKDKRYEDGYITLLKQDEACEALKELIHSKFKDVLIFPSVTGEYGEELSLDNTGKEMLKIVYYEYNLIITDSGISSEEEFNKLSDDIEKLLDENDVCSSGVVRYLNEPVDTNMTSDDFAKLLKNIDVFRWNDFISTR